MPLQKTSFLQSVSRPGTRCIANGAELVMLSGSSHGAAAAAACGTAARASSKEKHV